ncbi:RHS repeat domain-containing protein [Celerinatantimonas sp. YJH-8]|uniref:RHS repeat domain-containing protein n=1 Tax=Celerinatantimonas sp. YJH-8 TaxID=3228714 RepID=UPI0038C11D17
MQKEKRQYDNAGRVVKVGRFTYQYDACGRAVSKSEQKDGFRPQITRFNWDEQDRLTRIELPNGERWRYRYDAFGRRLSKECEQGAQSEREIEYRYDGAQVVQQILKAANGDALQTTEYIYEPGSFRPVAQVNTNHVHESEQLHYVVTDQAGTPRELCSEDGDIVWRGQQGLWQRHRQQQLKLNVERQFDEAANDPVQCDLRYQGQLEDRESGLYCNLNRYYDADSGQYLSPDPIGMAGGLRPQAYVHNPVDWGDPLGLAPEGCGASIKESKVLRVRSAEEVNQEMIAAGNQPAWLEGTKVTSEIVPKGTRYQMVVSEGQAKALTNGVPAFGGFATPEVILSQAFARDKLVILDEFKSDVSRVITVETTEAQRLNSGFTGPLGQYSGGVRQVEFIGERALKMIGEPRTLPLE